jgi:hypothetical protein
MPHRDNHLHHENPSKWVNFVGEWRRCHPDDLAKWVGLNRSTL